MRVRGGGKRGGELFAATYEGLADETCNGEDAIR